MRTPGPQRVTRIIGYSRVSSADQAIGSSLDDQKNAIAKEAKARGLKVAELFTEAESAGHEKFERREQMQALMRSVRTGDLILCDKLDRWSRDPEFSYRSLREIREAGAKVYFVGEQLDPSTPEGDSLLGFRVAFAREEHRRIRARTWGTRQILRDQGLYAEGLPPLGYKRQLPKGSRGPEKNILVADPVFAQLTINIFRWCVRGDSLGTIMDRLRETRKERQWDKKQLALLLRNRVYLGEVKDSRGDWIKGKHAPLIEPGIFDRAQRALAARKHGGATPRSDSHTSKWLLRTIGVCGLCGVKMSAAYGAGFGHGMGYFFYYSCAKKCGARYVPVKTADIAVDALVVERLVEIRQHLASSKPLRTNEVATPVIDFAMKREKLTAKQHRIVEAFTDGAMSRDRMRAEVAKLDAARTRLDADEAAEKRRSPLADSKVRRELLGRVATLRGWWLRAPIPAKRRALDLLAISVRLERDKPPIVAWRTFDELAAEIHP